MSKKLLLLLSILALAVVVAVALEIKYAVFSSFSTESIVENAEVTASSTPSIFDGKPVVRSVSEPEEMSAKEMPGAKEYVRFEGTGFDDAFLYIAPEKEGKVAFSIEAYWGANNGYVSGVAERQESEVTTYVFKDDENDVCTITFVGIGTQTIRVDTTDDCYRYGGVNVYFEGVFKEGGDEPAPSINWIFKKNTDQQAFNALVGGDKERFDNTAHVLSGSFEGSGTREVYPLYVGGLGSISESIVIIDSGRIWAAVLADSEVWYYTNVPADKLRLEATIEKWADSNKESYTVVYKTP